MRMRREATTRSPASSSILVIAPVRFRRVASGLMIEKVRSVAMAVYSSIDAGLIWRALEAPLRETASGATTSSYVETSDEPLRLRLGHRLKARERNNTQAKIVFVLPL